MRTAGRNITITINNNSVSYNDEGPPGKEVVLFIHGFPFNKSMWDGQTEILKDRYRVISYDVRGHGNSGAGLEEFSIDLFSHDLILLMDYLELDKIIICGLSMGGYIALNIMEKIPGRLKAVVLCDTQCTADTDEGRDKRMKAIDTIRIKGLDVYAEDTIRKLFAPSSLINKKKEVKLIRDMILQTAPESVCNTLLALANRKETCGKLHEVKIPVLILVGKEDVVTPPSSAELMNEKINGSEMHLIERAGHLSNLENKEDFNKHLADFLKSV